MFAKSSILFACLSIVLAAPEPKADPKADPLLVSAYSAGLPIVNTYSTAGAALPIISAYSHSHAHHLHHAHAHSHALPAVHARTVAIDAPVVAADVPVAVSAVNPLHYTAVSSPVAAVVV